MLIPQTLDPRMLNNLWSSGVFVLLFEDRYFCHFWESLPWHSLAIYNLHYCFEKFSFTGIFFYLIWINWHICWIGNLFSAFRYGCNLKVLWLKSFALLCFLHLKQIVQCCLFYALVCSYLNWPLTSIQPHFPPNQV